MAIRRPNKLKPGTLRYRIVALSMYAGELPYRSIRYMGTSSASSCRTARGLVKYGFLTEERGRLRHETIRSLKPNIRMIGQDGLFPDCFLYYYGAKQFANAAVNAHSAESSRKRLRSIRGAEAAAFLDACGTGVIPGEKPAMADVKKAVSPAYYSSRETGSVLSEEMRLLATGRASGYLYVPEGEAVYQVFSLGTSNIELSERVEQETLAVCAMAFSMQGITSGIRDAIVLGNSMSVMGKVLGGEAPPPFSKVRRTSLMVYPQRYAHMYFFPKTAEGVMQMKIFLSRGPRALKEWAAGSGLEEGGWRDTYREDYGNILAATDGDMRQIKRFIRAAMDDPEGRYTIGCFRFQEDVIRACTEGVPNISVLRGLDITEAYRDLYA